ncbi:hypothetical protein Q8A73_023696 [Channa argus]|nr:hypothetical protein Q8A73_023696 [Channa argus]
MSGSLNVTFLTELVLMLAVWLRRGLCSGLERECLITGERSVAAGRTSHCGEREVAGCEPPRIDGIQPRQTHYAARGGESGSRNTHPGAEGDQPHCRVTLWIDTT